MQFELLIKRLKSDGEQVSGVHFPKIDPEFLNSIVQKSKQFSAVDGFRAALNACAKRYIQDVARIEQPLSAGRHVIVSNYILFLAARVFASLTAAGIELPSDHDISSAIDEIRTVHNLPMPHITVVITHGDIGLNKAFQHVISEYGKTLIQIEAKSEGVELSAQAIHDRVWEVFTSLRLDAQATSSEAMQDPMEETGTMATSEPVEFESHGGEPAVQSMQLTLGEWYYRSEKDEDLDIYNPFDAHSINQFYQGPHRSIEHAEWAKLNHQPLFNHISETAQIVVVRPGERLLVHSREFYYAPLDNPLISPFSHNGVLLYLKSNVTSATQPQRFIFELVNLNQRTSVVLVQGEQLAQIALKAHESMIIGSDAAIYNQLIENWSPTDMLPLAMNSNTDSTATLKSPSTQTPQSAEPPMQHAVLEPTPKEHLLTNQIQENNWLTPAGSDSLEYTSEAVSALALVRLLSLGHNGLLSIEAKPTSFTDKDEKNNYRYVTPRSLNAQSARDFEAAINGIFANYQTMERQLKENEDRLGKTLVSRAREALLGALPLACKFDVHMRINRHMAKEICIALMSDDLHEVRLIGERLHTIGREAHVEHFNDTNIEQSVQRVLRRRQKLSKQIDAVLPSGLGLDNTAGVQLIARQPLNEFELLAPFLFQNQNIGAEDLLESISMLSYEEKRRLHIGMLKAAFDHQADVSLASSSLTWEIASDITTLVGVLQTEQWRGKILTQRFSPRLGYQVMRSIEETGLSDLFEKNFDISFELFSTLQTAGYELEAQYAVLNGHRARWQNSSQLNEFIANVDMQHTRSTRKLAHMLLDTLKDIYPLTSEILDAQLMVGE